MSITLIAIVTLIYMGVFVSEAFNQSLGMAVVYLGYSIANLGLIMAMSK